MADRRVTNTRKDWNGDITALCNPDQPWWSPIDKAGAIAQIKQGIHRYYMVVDGKEVDIQVADSPPNEHLHADLDPSHRNRLQKLPDC